MLGFSPLSSIPLSSLPGKRLSVAISESATAADQELSQLVPGGLLVESGTLNDSQFNTATFATKLTERISKNRYLNSQNINLWGLGASVTFTSNTDTDPLYGTQTVSYLTNSPNLTCSVTPPQITNGAYRAGTTFTKSIYAKAISGSPNLFFQAISYASTGAQLIPYLNANFNLSTGAVVSNAAGTTANITSAGSGWYRCQLTFTVPSYGGSGNSNPIAGDSFFVGGYGSTPTQTTIALWGAQVEENSSATSYEYTGADASIGGSFADVDTASASVASLLTESGTASDSADRGFLSLVNLTETGTASDSANRVLLVSNNLTETGTASETETNVRIARAYLTNTTPFANSISNITSAVGEVISTVTTGRGLRFISNKTEVLGNIGIAAYKVITQNGAPTTTGTVEVWQLATNSVTAAPSTLRASKTVNYSDLPCPLSSIAPITNSLLGSAGLTQYISASVDDGFQNLTLPWSVNYLGTTYSTVYVGSNSYLSFGTGASTYTILSPVSPSVPKICISSTDNSYQQVFAGTEGTAPNRTYRIRYEGTAATSGTVGTPNIVWEMVLYENNTSQIDIQIGANARGGAGFLHGIYTLDAQVGSLTDVAGTTTYTNIGWRIVSNTVEYLNSKNITYFDLSSSNVTLNSGTAYLVGIKSGSDWSLTKQVYGIYSLNTGATGISSSQQSPASGSAQLTEYAHLYPNVYYPATTTGAWSSASVNSNVFSFSVYSTTDFLNTIDSANGGFLADASETENNTSASDTEDAAITITIFTDLTETGAASETETNIATSVSVITETGTASETEDPLVTAFRSLTETGTSLDSQFNTFVTAPQLINESGTADDSPLLGGYSVVRDITETGTGSDNQSNLVSFLTLINETGTATETETNIATRVSVITETGSVTDAETTSVLFVSQLTETGTANETETNIATRVSVITETGSVTDAETNVVSAFRTLTETGSSADSQFNVFTTNQFLIESATADNTENRTVVALRDITETGSSTDSQFNLTSFLTLINETGTATETETSQANFYPAVTENVGISATESENNSIVTNQSTTENVGISATESETLTISILNQLWEYTSKNLVKSPNDISGSYWSTQSTATVSTNVAVAPDGTQTADKLIGNNGNTTRKSVYYGGAYLTQNTTYTYSVYLKQAGFTNAAIWFDIPFANIGPNGYQGSGALINLIDGSTSGVTPTVTTVTSVGNGWYRCSVTGTTKLPWTFGVAGTIPTNLQISLGDPNGVGTATGDGTSGIYVWGAQLELGSSVTTFVDPNETDTQTNIITTTQTVTENVGISATETETSQADFYPVISETGSGADSLVGNKTASSNSSETGSASETESTQIRFVSSLLENTNKNLFYVPSNLSNSIWIKSSSTITSGQTDPNNGTTAFLLTATNLYSAIYNTNPGISPGTYTVSVYVKYGTSTYFTIVNESTTGVDPVAHYATFTMSGTPVVYVQSNATGTLTSVGNSWYLATMTYTLIAGATFRPKFWVGTYTSTNYTGQTVYLWRPQVELGSSATAFVDPNETVTQDRTLTATRDVTETGTADETETRVVLSTRTITETNTSSDDQTNTAIRLADLIESITATELTSAQAAFISAIQETLSAIDSGISNKITTSDIAEIVSALDSQNRFAFYVGDISELLNAVSLERSAEFAFITETGSLSTIELANILVNRGILETVDPTDSQFRQVITNSYITEISVAGESVVVWVFFAMDYELVTSRYSAGIEIEEDQIYVDNIDVFYLDVSKIMVGMDVSFDQIYVDNVDVLYGNIAIIDDIVSDEIYI